MLKQASIDQIRSGEISRDQGYVIVAMCFYPRGLRKDLMDEYRADLGPDRTLFKEWKATEQRHGHEAAFAETHYEERFHLDHKTLKEFKAFAEFAKKTDIYLVCQCQVGERCHREMLMLLGRHWGAPTDAVFNNYPQFEKRIDSASLAG